jgi:hypothetical protein
MGLIFMTDLGLFLSTQHGSYRPYRQAETPRKLELLQKSLYQEHELGPREFQHRGTTRCLRPSDDRLDYIIDIMAAFIA